RPRSSSTAGAGSPRHSGWRRMHTSRSWRRSTGACRPARRATNSFSSSARTSSGSRLRFRPMRGLRSRSPSAESRSGGAVDEQSETKIREGKMASVEQVQGSETTAEEVVNTVVEEGARLGVKRFFTIPGRDPFDEIEWETRDAIIPGRDGPAFEQRSVEFPKFWSQTATNIV